MRVYKTLTTKSTTARSPVARNINVNQAVKFATLCLWNGDGRTRHLFPLHGRLVGACPQYCGVACCGSIEPIYGRQCKGKIFFIFFTKTLDNVLCPCYTIITKGKEIIKKWQQKESFKTSARDFKSLTFSFMTCSPARKILSRI